MHQKCVFGQKTGGKGLYKHYYTKLLIIITLHNYLTLLYIYITVKLPAKSTRLDLSSLYCRQVRYCCLCFKMTAFTAFTTMLPQMLLFFLFCLLCKIVMSSGKPISFSGPFPWLGSGAAPSQGKGPGNEVAGKLDQSLLS